MRFGRHRPDPARHERQPRFRAFRTASPLVIPDAWSFSALCPDALQTMLGNGPDASAPPQIAETGVGNCTCASPSHCIDVWTAGAGAPVTITTAQAVRLYELSCGYVLGQASTDNGGDELTVLDYIEAHGIDGNGLHRIGGTASIDMSTGLDEPRAGLFLTGALLLCAELPDSYPSVSLNGEGVWDIAGPPNPNQGHAFPALDFTTNCPNGKPAWRIVTWGGFVWYTTEAAAYYSAPAQGGSANLALTREWIGKARQTAPNALDWSGLSSRFQQLGGIIS